MNRALPIDPTAPELLEFYSRLVAYYRNWARLHRAVYWGLMFCVVGSGLSVGWLLLFKAEAVRIAALALFLNGLLVVSNVIGADRKYPRYRTVELRLVFELQRLRQGVARQVMSGVTPDTALLAELEILHPKVESLVLAEFSEFFGEFKTLGEVHGQFAQAAAKK
ncbi:MAG: hypothetical protein ABI625_22040 [bacterium]